MKTESNGQGQESLASASGSVQFVVQQKFIGSWDDIHILHSLTEAYKHLNADNARDGRPRRIIKRTELEIAPNKQI